MNYILIKNIDNSGLDELILSEGESEHSVYLQCVQEKRKFESVSEIESIPKPMPYNMRFRYITRKESYEYQRDGAENTPFANWYEKTWEEAREWDRQRMSREALIRESKIDEMEIGMINLVDCMNELQEKRRTAMQSSEQATVATSDTEQELATTYDEARQYFPDVARYVVESLITDSHLIQRKFPIREASILTILDIMTFSGILGTRSGGYYTKISWNDDLRPYITKGMTYFGSQRPGKEDLSDRSRHIPQSVRDAVWRRAGGKCEQCGSRTNLEFDHIVPFSKGGSNTYRNVQLLCQDCNRHKSDHIG